MEHSATYLLGDGTEYRLTWDTESPNGQMHYLLHEDGVLKLECWHHAVPQHLTEDQMRSTLIPSSFFKCLDRHISAVNMLADAERLEGPRRELVRLMAEPHVDLTEAQEDYVRSIIERGHDTALLVEMLKEARIEAFAAQLNATPEVVGGSVDILPIIDPPSSFKRNLPAILWAVGVVTVSAAAIFASEIFGR